VVEIASAFDLQGGKHLVHQGSHRQRHAVHTACL
jgi:hypothetical protein